MRFQPTKIPDVVLIHPDVFEDPRGYFLESWQARKFAEAGLGGEIVQANHSHSLRYVLRGLHYQIRQPQGKLIRVVAGEVFDVAVDMRRSSATFGRWVGVLLSDKNHHMLWVPPGFAHGFLVLSEAADFEYYCTDFWAPIHERAIVWNDPDVGVTWPLSPDEAPLVSEKDARATRFREAEYFL